MADVWWVGLGNERVITSTDWAGYGIDADTISWNATNGWSVPHGVFNNDQLAILGNSDEFLLGQEGPRFNRPPTTPGDFTESAYVYAARVKAMYDLLLANGFDIPTAIEEAINAVVGAAPEALNTLQELAAALNDDEDFAAELTAAVAQKASISEMDWVARQSGSNDVPVQRTYWRGKADGPAPAAFDTGQAVNYLSDMHIAGGKLTFTPAGVGNSGSYMWFNAGAPVTRIGARFVFADGSTGTGSAVMALHNNALVFADSAFKMSAHFVITPTNWNVQKYRNDTFTFTTLYAGTFDTPLVTDGKREYKAEIYRVGNTLTLVLPDDNVISVTDADIGGWAGNHAFFECYTDLPTDDVAGFTETWFDTGTQIPPSTYTRPDAITARNALGIPLFIDVSAAPYNVTPAVADPEVGIQAAIDYAAANGIPEVIVSRPGTYTVDLHVIPGQTFYAAAIWARSNVKLVLAPGVVIKLKNGATLPAGASAAHIIGGDANTLKTGWVVEGGGTVDGNAANQSATTVVGGVALNRCRSSYVKDILVKSLYGTASAPPGETLHFEATKCRDVKFINCEADGSGSANTATGFSSNHSFGVSWTDCIAHDMGFGMGFTNWQSSGLRYTDCHAYKCGANGFNAERSEGIVYSSCIAGSRSPLIDGTSENPYFPGGQAELGNGKGFAIHGCTDVVGVGCVSTFNGVNLYIYTNNGMSPPKVCERVLFVGGSFRPGTSATVLIEKASDGGGAQDQIEVNVLASLAGNNADWIYHFNNAPVLAYNTNSGSGLRWWTTGSGGWLYRWMSGTLGSQPIGGSAVMGINGSGQLATSGRQLYRRAVTGSTTITLQDEVIVHTSTAAPATDTLPSAATAGAGATYTVKDESGGAATNNITIARAGSDTIEGATSKVINANYGWIRLMSTGAGWAVIADSSTNTLTGKAFDLASNTLTGTTAQFNTALSDGDFATLAGTETLPNKTLSSPALTGTAAAAVSAAMLFYNTADQAANYERVRHSFASNVYTIAAENGGTGVARTIRLSSNNKHLTVGDSSLGWFDFNAGNTGVATPTARISGTAAQSSGTTALLAIISTINQSGTAAYTGLLINPTESALGSGAKNLIDAQVGGTSKFKVDNGGNTTLADAANLAVGTGTGTKIGTATSQKIGFWNATPIVQPTIAVAAAAFVANTSAIANDTATFDGYTIGQVVKALRNSGILA